MQKIKKKKTAQFLDSIKRTFKSDIWIFIAPFLTLLLAALVWIVLAVNKTARLEASKWIIDFPQPFTSMQVLFGAAILFLVAAALYFWLDYKQHITLLRRDDPKIKYSAVHHAQKVVLPKLKYNWKQSLYWVGYGLVSMAVVVSVLTVHVKPTFAALMPSVTTGVSSAVSQTGATLSGTNSAGAASTRGFQYGLTTSYGSTIPVSTSISFGFSSRIDDHVNKVVHGPNNSIFIINTDDFTVKMFNSSGSVQHQWNFGADGIAFDSEQNIYFTAYDDSLSVVSVRKYDPSGSNLLDQWGSFANDSAWYDIAINASDQVYITDSVNNRILNYSSSGTPLNEWGVSGTGNGQFLAPTRILLDSNSNVYVVDQVSVQNFTSAGDFLNRWDLDALSAGCSSTTTATTGCIALDANDNFYILGPTNSLSPVKIRKYDSSGNLTWQQAYTYGSGDGQLNTPKALAVNEFGNIFVADTGNNRIQEFSPTGAYLSKWGTSGSGNMQFFSPNYVSIEDGDSVIVADFSSVKKYQQVSNAGSFSASLTSLDCGTTYHYRAYVSNGEAVVYGNDASFTTNDCSYDPDEFVTIWKTDNPGSSNSDQIIIPANPGETYNYSVSWGDNTTSTGQTGNATHTYTTPGTYTVKITGTFPQIYFNGIEDGQKIVDIKQWGSNAWTSMENAFNGASNLQISASDAPNLSGVSSMANMFYGASSLNQPLNDWDVSHVTDMSGLFYAASSFNNGGVDGLGSWDVSNVTTMSQMFTLASSFNQDISNWNVSHVIDMSHMFDQASSFNNGGVDGLGSWDVSNVTNMSQMFAVAPVFNQDISNWNVSSVTDMQFMFYAASSFNQPLNNWNVSSVTNMLGMFGFAYDFNQPLDNWNTDNVANMAMMFAGASSFDQSLATWNVSDVASMNLMFMPDGIYKDGNPDPYPSSGLSTANYDATLASWAAQNLQSDVHFDAGTSTYCAAVADRQAIIDDFTWTINDAGLDCTAPDFTEAFITTWKTDNDGGSASNQITIPTYDGSSGWETSPESYNYAIDWGDGQVETGVTGDKTHTYASPGIYTVKITGVFPRIYFDSHGGDDNNKLLTVEQWGDNHWSSMAWAFYGASNLTIPATDTPDLSGVSDMNSMFYGATSFNQSINDWDVSNVTDMYQLFNGATSFNQPLNKWNVSKVTNMGSMFAEASTFNRPIETWNTSKVETLKTMFYGASSFNQPVSGWDTTKVTDMESVFTYATSFNQPLDGWDTSKVTSMWGMFGAASSFNQSLNTWDTSSVTQMTAMFAGASSFDRSLGSWDVSKVTDMTQMFLDAPIIDGYNNLEANGLSTANYDATIAGWATHSLQDGVTFDAGTSTYCNSEVQRQGIIDTYSWAINDAGKDCASTVKHVQTNQPDKLSSSQARLKGSVSGAGAGSFASGGFEWGTSTVYGNTITNKSISSSKFSATVTLNCDTQYHYRAFAVDAQNHRTYGANTTFTLACANANDPDSSPQVGSTTPSITIISPKPNQGFKVGSNVTLKANASSAVGVKEVRFYIDGKLVGTVTKVPYSYEVTNLKAGTYRLIAVAEDSAGNETATNAQSFVVSKSGETLLALLPTNNFTPISGGIEQNKYAISGFAASVTRILPIVLLQILALLYLWQAYNQNRQNQQAKRQLAATQKIAEDLQGFLHIVTHYLGTPITTISLAAEALIATKLQNVPITLEEATNDLKSYVNKLTTDLNAQSMPAKQILESAGAVSSYPFTWWVAVPVSVAALLTLGGVFVAPALGLFAANTATNIVTGVSLLAVTLLTGLFFITWQRGRQLAADINVTKKTADNLLNNRRNFITEHQSSLHTRVDELQALSLNIRDANFKKHFDSGLEQLAKTVTAFGQVAELTQPQTNQGFVKEDYIMKSEVAKYNDQARGYGLELIYEGLPHVGLPFTPSELGFMLSHLVDNAVAFTPAGGQVYVSTKRKARKIYLSVADTGRGIPEEKIHTLMQPFSRATSTETYNYEGLGLSLYIVRLIAEKYGGDVKLLSHEGKGTVVTIEV